MFHYYQKWSNRLYPYNTSSESAESSRTKAIGGGKRKQGLAIADEKLSRIADNFYEPKKLSPSALILSGLLSNSSGLVIQSLNKPSMA